ncbi:MAG: DsrE family protein [Chromatiales bacterium]|jgi:intracellular sulfur oxidation DsrE/DsrF family protein
MKMMNHLIAAFLIVLSQGVMAGDAPDDSDALKGVSKGKVIFDINMVQAQKMTLYLSVIKQTLLDLERQNVEPDIILAFRGLSVRLISKNRDQMDLTDFEHLDKIAAQLAELQQLGARIEACSVATKLFKVDNDSLLDGIKPVGNTFVSLTGYQAQGYANIPIY